jgi:hypothetical protein
VALLRELPERMRSQRIKVGAGQDDVSNTRGNTAARSSVVGGNTAVPIGQRIQCCSHAVQKLLLHMVLTHKRSIDPEAPPEDLNFAAAVRYLGENGVITAAMNNLAVNIKDVGNKANHELPHITQTEANDIALFTHYLFISV